MFVAPPRRYCGVMSLILSAVVVVVADANPSCSGHESDIFLDNISPKYPRTGDAFVLTLGNANTSIYQQSVYILHFDDSFGSGCSQASTNYVATASTFNTTTNTRTINAANAGQTEIAPFSVSSSGGDNLVLTVVAPAEGGYLVCIGTNLISKPFFIRAKSVDMGDFVVLLLSLGLPGLLLTILAVFLWKIMGFEIRTIPFYFERWVPEKFASCFCAPKVFFIICGVLVSIIFIAQPVLFILLGILTVELDVLTGLVIIVLAVVFTIVLNLILFNIGNGWRFNILTVVGLAVSLAAIGSVVLCMALLTYPFFFSVFTFLALFVNGLCLVLYFYYSSVDTDGLRVLLYHLQSIMPPTTVDAVGSMALPFQKVFLPVQDATADQISQMSDILQTDEDADRISRKRYRRIVLGATLTPIYLAIVGIYIAYVYARYPIDTGVPPVSIIAAASTAVLDICFILLSDRFAAKGGGGGGGVALSPLHKVGCAFAYRFIIAGVGDRWWMMGQVLLYVLIAGYIAIKCVSMYFPPTTGGTDGVFLAAVDNINESAEAPKVSIFAKIQMFASRWDVVWVGLTLCFIAEVIYASTLGCIEAEHIGINSTNVAPYLYGIGALLLAPIAALFFLALRLRELQVGPSYVWMIALAVAIAWVIGGNIYIVFVTKSVVITGAFLWGLPGLLVFTLFMARLRANNMKEVYVAGVSNVHNPHIQHFIRVALRKIRISDDEGALLKSWTKSPLDDPNHPLSTLVSAYVHENDRALLAAAWKEASECNDELYAFTAQFIMEVNERCHIRLVGEVQQVSAEAEFSSAGGGGGGGGGSHDLELQIPGLLDKILTGRGCPSVKASELENIMLTMPDLLRQAAQVAWESLGYVDEEEVTADDESGMFVRKCSFKPKEDTAASSSSKKRKPLPSDLQFRITDIDSNAEQLLKNSWSSIKSSSQSNIIEIENMRIHRLEKIVEVSAEPSGGDGGGGATLPSAADDVMTFKESSRPSSANTNNNNTNNNAPSIGTTTNDDNDLPNHPNAPSSGNYTNNGDSLAVPDDIEFSRKPTVDRSTTRPTVEKSNGTAVATTSDGGDSIDGSAALGKMKAGVVATRHLLGDYLRPRHGYLYDHPAIARYHIIFLFFLAELLFLIMGIFVGELSDPRYVGWAMAVGAIVVTHSFAGFVRYFHTFTASLWILMYVIIPEIALLAYGLAVYFNDIRDSDVVGARILLFLAIGYPFAAALVMFVTVWRHYGWSSLRGALDHVRTDAAASKEKKRKRRMYIHIAICLAIALLTGIGAAVLSIFVWNSWVAFPLVLVATFLAIGVAITYGIVRSNAGVIPTPIIIVWLVVCLLIVGAAVVIGIVIGFWFAGVSVVVAFAILVLAIDATRREFATNFLLGGRYSVGGPLLFPFFALSEENKVITVGVGRVEALLAFALIFVWGLVTALSVAPPAIGLITSIVGAGLTVLYYLEKVRLTSYSLYLARHYITDDVVSKAFGAGATRVLQPELRILRQHMIDTDADGTGGEAALDMTPGGGEVRSWESQILTSIASSHPTVRQAVAGALEEYGVRQKAGAESHTLENIWEIDPTSTTPLSTRNSNEAYKKLEMTLVESILDESGCKDEERASRTEDVLVDLQGVPGLEEKIIEEFSKRWNTEKLSPEGAAKYIQLAQRLYVRSQIEYQFIAFSLVMLDFYTADAKRNSKRTLRDWLEFVTGREFTDEQLDDFILNEWSDNSRRGKYLTSFTSFLRYRDTEAMSGKLYQTEAFAISEFEKMKKQENSEWEDILFDLEVAKEEMIALQRRSMAFGDASNLLWQTAANELRQMERESDDWWHATHTVHSNNISLLQTMYRDLGTLSSTTETHDRQVIETSEQSTRNAAMTQHNTLLQMHQEARSQQEMEELRIKQDAEERLRLEQEAQVAEERRLAAQREQHHRGQRDALEVLEQRRRAEIVEDEATNFTPFFRKAKSEAEEILVRLAKKVTPRPEPPRPPSPTEPSGPTGKDVGTMSEGVISLQDLQAVASKRLVKGMYTDPDFKNLKIAGKKSARVFPRKAMHLMDEDGAAFFSDVRQGALGDCWLLAAISSVASLQNGAVIRDSIMPYWKTVNGGKFNDRIGNVFPVVLYVNGKKTTYVVDDLLPHNRADLFLYCELHDTRRAWASMLEKASARRFKGFSCLDGGRSQEGFEMLMGAVGTMISYKPDDPDVVSGKVWSTLVTYYANGYPMACSSMSGSDATTNNMNIVQGHAFSLLHVVELEKDIRLLNVRNPWGSTEWSGAYSDKSNKWTPQLKSRMESLGFPLKEADDGAFWIEYRDFVRNFRGVAAGILHPKAEFAEYRTSMLKWPTSKKLVVGTISISAGSPVKLFISITQSDRRAEVGETDFGVPINLFLMKNGARHIKADDVFQYERSLFIDSEVSSANNQKYDIQAQHLSDPSEVGNAEFFVRVFVAHKDLERVTIHKSVGLELMIDE